MTGNRNPYIAFGNKIMIMKHSFTLFPKNIIMRYILAGHVFVTINKSNI